MRGHLGLMSNCEQYDKEYVYIQVIIEPEHLVVQTLFIWLIQASFGTFCTGKWVTLNILWTRNGPNTQSLSRHNFLVGHISNGDLAEFQQPNPHLRPIYAPLWT